ncbi:MAG: AI-2E family transporter [Chloroflexota bacterium]
MTAESPTHGPPTSVAPEWLVNLAALGWRILATCLLAVVVLYISAVLFTVTASVLIAIVVAATFAPFVLALRNRGWSRTAAAAAVTVGAVLVAGATIVLITLAFVPYVPAVQTAVQNGAAQLQTFLAAVNLPSDTQAVVQQVIDSAQSWARNAVAAIADGAVTVVTISILAGFLVFFFLQDGDTAWRGLVPPTPPAQRTPITESGDDALQRVGGYLRGTAVLAATDAISDFVFLVVLGVPLAAPLAVLVFFGGFIPYLGGLATTIVLVLVTWATNGPRDVVILLVLITIMNLIQGNLLSPLIYRKTVNLHPALVLTALPAGAAVAGIVGLFVAIPVVAIVLAVAGAAVEILEPGEEVERPALVPGWLDRLGQWSWRLLVVVALAALTIQAVVAIPMVVIPLTVALILAATFVPLVHGLEGRGWKRGPAAVAVTGGGFLLVVLITLLAVASLAGQAQAIATASAAGASSVDQAASGTVGWLGNVVSGAGTTVVVATAFLIAGLASLAVVLILAALLCVYFLRDGDRFWHLSLSRLEAGRGRDIDRAGSRAVTVLGNYMIGTGAISAFGAATQFAVMAVLGIPLALPLAVLSFIGGFIPYIGSFVTTGIALLVTVAVGSPTDVAVMAVFTVVFNIVQGNFVAPVVYGRAVNLHPAVVLMAIPAGSAVAGVIGMFLAVPVIGVIATTWRTILHVFDSDSPLAEEVVLARPRDEELAPDMTPVAVGPDGGA